MAKRKSKERGAARPSWKRALRREIASAGKVLVLGIGNPDRGDDGAGVLCARELAAARTGQARGRLKVLVGYETPENLTGEIRRFAPGLVLLVDAVVGPHPAGTVFPVGAEDIPDDGVSTHKISLKMLVTYLETTVGCRVRFLGIQAGSLELGRTLTPSVEKAARTLARWLGESFKKGIRP
jgi:hydrogenase maturation protease